MKRTRWMRAAVSATALIALAGCTPSQIRAWQAWHQKDPEAALAFANQPEVQAQLQQRSQPATRPAPSVGGGTVWDRLAECESGQNWSYNGGSGYDGGLQFLPATWRAYGGQEYAEYAWQASREAQIDIAERVLDDVGWGAWPACSRRLGLR